MTFAIAEFLRNYIADFKRGVALSQHVRELCARGHRAE